jgi:hypothetical protein
MPLKRLLCIALLGCPRLSIHVVGMKDSEPSGPECPLWRRPYRRRLLRSAYCMIPITSPMAISPVRAAMMAKLTLSRRLNAGLSARRDLAFDH